MAAEDGPAPDDLDPAALARAEAALAALASTYLTWADRDVARLADCLGAALTAPEGPAPHLLTLFRLAHDMKGQATTFGYPLVTEIGHRLCRLIERTPDPTPADLDRIAAHVTALAEAVTLRLEGDGGEAGRRLLAGIVE